MKNPETDALRLVPVEPTEAMILEGVKAAQRAEQTGVSWPEMASFTYRAMLTAAPASPLPGGGWQDISTAPKDGKLFLGCNLDHPSFGSWPMYRRVKHGFDDDGGVVSQDLGAWVKIIDVEPDYEDGFEVGPEPKYSVAPDDLNKSVRYGWKPFPLPSAPTGEPK